MDITGYCRDLIKILEQAENMSEKLTPLKLIDAWSGKGVSKLRVAEVTPPKHPREELERIIAHLLLQQYLKYVRCLLLFLTSSSHFSLLSCYFCIVLMDTGCRLLFSLISDAFNVFLKTSKDYCISTSKCLNRSWRNIWNAASLSVLKGWGLLYSGWTLNLQQASFWRNLLFIECIYIPRLTKQIGFPRWSLKSGQAG